MPTHVLFDGSGNEYRQSTPWADGDTYISKKSVYDAAYPQFVQFIGAGLNDMTSNGIFYLNPASITIKIDSTGTPDTFKVSFDGGSTWDSTLNPITGTAQTIITGVTVTFGTTTTHTLDDEWIVYRTDVN
jgi:hypothetical protein